MPASLKTNLSSQNQQCEKGLCRNPSPQCIEKSSRVLNIGLINNMPDGALEATERQFLSLLDSASEGISVHLSLYALPNVPRNEFGARHIREHYSSVESLCETRLDGLIVTGREPLTPDLKDEPYWNAFTNVVDWARKNTYSTIWSCLAAHAATLHMDGITRIRNEHKHCGVFDCARLSDHPLTAGTPFHYKLPHSRWNGLPPEDLMRCGYRVLTQAARVGADTFIKHCKSMFVFFQGHPEYEANTLLLEYRRDVSRFVRGESVNYPLIPQAYFDAATRAALTALQQKAMGNRESELLIELSEILDKTPVENSWRSTAACIYKNWLQYIYAQKKLTLGIKRERAVPHAISPMIQDPTTALILLRQ
jgi:homoserine O-succinyltransferase